MTDIRDEIQKECYKLNHEAYADNRAFRMSHKSYDFSSYVNHAIAFYHSDNWDGLALFTKRAKKFLVKDGSCVNQEYRDQAELCLKFFETFILEHCGSESAKQVFQEI